MKNRKKILTLLLAFGMLGFSTALYACDNAALNPPSISQSGASENPDSSTDSSLDSPSDSSTPESSAPESSAPSDTPTAPPNNNGNNSTTTPPQKPVVVSAQYIRCTGNNVNIRSGAGTEFSILGSAEQGTMYALIEKKGDWYKTYYRNKVAYIYASYTQVFTLEKSKDSDVEDVIDEGYKLIGTPYVYGAVRLHNGNGTLLSGFNVQKFDCSSLMQYIFYHGSNTMLGLHTRAQVKQGKYVHPNDLQRGDCIFFTNEDRQYNTGIERVGHVALYLGNNYILHTASDYARIEKMTTSRWNYYIEARRFV